MTTLCPVCRSGLESAAEGLRCTGCGAVYAIVDDVPLLVPPQLSKQHEHQRGYFDAEFAQFGSYEVDPWRKSFNDRIFPAIGVSQATAPYLDVGVGGSGATVIEAARAGVEAVGCDLSVEGVVRAARFAASEGLAERTSFVVCAAERLPFANESRLRQRGRGPRASGRRRRSVGGHWCSRPGGPTG